MAKRKRRYPDRVFDELCEDLYQECKDLEGFEGSKYDLYEMIEMKFYLPHLMSKAGFMPTFRILNVIRVKPKIDPFRLKYLQYTANNFFMGTKKELKELVYNLRESINYLIFKKNNIGNKRNNRKEKRVNYSILETRPKSFQDRGIDLEEYEVAKLQRHIESKSLQRKKFGDVRKRFKIK